MISSPFVRLRCVQRKRTINNGFEPCGERIGIPQVLGGNVYYDATQATMPYLRFVSGEKHTVVVFKYKKSIA